MTFYGPDGEVSPQNGIYLAYDEGRRFVTTDAFTEDFQPAGPFMIGIWVIEPEGEGTRYTARARHWRSEEHTSELQSLLRIPSAVFCLKNKISNTFDDNAHTNYSFSSHTFNPNETQIRMTKLNT